jgi:hypothetical protein
VNQNLVRGHTQDSLPAACGRSRPNRCGCGRLRPASTSRRTTTPQSSSPSSCLPRRPRQSLPLFPIADQTCTSRRFGFGRKSDIAPQHDRRKKKQRKCGGPSKIQSEFFRGKDYADLFCIRLPLSPRFQLESLDRITSILRLALLRGPQVALLLRKSGSERRDRIADHPCPARKQSS